MSFMSFICFSRNAQAPNQGITYRLGILHQLPLFKNTSPRTLDVYEIAVVYKDSQHGGDRRKTSQQCFLLLFTKGFYLNASETHLEQQ